LAGGVRGLPGVADTLGHDQPNNNPAADDKGQEQKNQAQPGVSFVHLPYLNQQGDFVIPQVKGQWPQDPLGTGPGLLPP